MSEMCDQRVIRVVEDLCRQLHPQQSKIVELSSHLEWELGIGSLERAELIRRLEVELGRTLPASALFAASRVRDLIQLVDSPSQGQLLGQFVQPPSVVDELPPPPIQARSLLEALDYQRSHQGRRQLLFFEEQGQLLRSLSPEELWREVAGTALGLQQRGVKPGEPVALMLPTGLPFVASFLAIQWLRAVPVPLYPPWRADEVEDYLQRQLAILDNARVQRMISFERAWTMTQLLQLRSPWLKEVVSADSLRLEGDPPPLRGQEHDLALVQYTSGSTGSPKGVALSQSNLLHNIRAYGRALDLGGRDICLSWLPLYHDMGLIGALLGSLYHGIPLVLQSPQDFLARPSRWLQGLSQYRGSISPAPNFAYDLCARRLEESEIAGLNLSSWKAALNGAEQVRAETLQRFEQRFAPVGFSAKAWLPCYGLAEASLAVTFSPLGRGAKVDRIDPEALRSRGLALPLAEGQPWVSSGVPLQGSELCLRDAQGRPVGERQQGRVYFRSGSSLREYYLRGSVQDDEGWVDTGDLGYQAEGELYLTGRAKDLIIKGGRNLCPQDIEAAVAEVAGVRRGCVAAFSLTGAEGEQLVVAFETRNRSQALLRQVDQAVRRAVACGPDHLLALRPGSIPKTPSGKVQRSLCADWYLAGRLGRRPSAAWQSLRTLSKLPWRHSGRAFQTALALFGVVGMPALLLAPFRPSLARRLMPGACRRALGWLGLSLEIHGQREKEPCLLLANHASLLDPLLLLAASAPELLFLAAPWIYDHPILAPAMRNLGHLKISRGQGNSGPPLAQTIADQLQQGRWLACFPEGGLETSPGLREFHLGVFQIAAQLGLRVQPVALRGTRRALAWPGLVPQAGVLEVEFGPTWISQSCDLAGAVDLARQVRDWLSLHCGEPCLQQRLRRQE